LPVRRAVAPVLGVGFSDQSQFARAFLGITGETPRAFRRWHR
jgi:AraC-like DNA-binding protein